jgi:hypothetical protein
MAVCGVWGGGGHACTAATPTKAPAAGPSWSERVSPMISSALQVAPVGMFACLPDGVGCVCGPLWLGFAYATPVLVRRQWAWAAAV